MNSSFLFTFLFLLLTYPLFISSEAVFLYEPNPFRSPAIETAELGPFCTLRSSPILYSTTVNRPLTFSMCEWLDVVHRSVDVEQACQFLAVEVVPSDGEALAPDSYFDPGSHQFHFVPQPDFVGMVAFTYTVSVDCERQPQWCAVLVPTPSTSTIIIDVLPRPASEAALMAVNDLFRLAGPEQQKRPQVLDVLHNDLLPSAFSNYASVSLVVVVDSIVPNVGALWPRYDGVLVYLAPDPNYEGVVVFRYQIVSKATGRSSEAEVTIVMTGAPDPPSLPPLVIDRSQTALVNSPTFPLAPSLLATSSDPDGNLDPRSLTILTPANQLTGVVTLDLAAGNVLYNPQAGWVGIDHFQYQLCDFTNLCSIAAVSIAIVNPPPLKAQNDLASGFVNQAISIPLLANDFGTLAPDSITLLNITGNPTQGLHTALNPLTGTLTLASPTSGNLMLSYQVCSTWPSQLVPCVSAKIDVQIWETPAPIAYDDVIVIARALPEAGFLAIDVMANDVDVICCLDPTTVRPLSSISQAGAELIAREDGSILYQYPAALTTLDSYLIDTFFYEVCDVRQICARARVSVELAPVDVPVAANATYLIDRLTPSLLIDLDVNPGYSPFDLAGNATIVFSPSYLGGTVLVQSEVLFRVLYSPPDGGFVGTDRFAYVICNVFGRCSNQATITIIATAGTTAPIAKDEHIFAPIGTLVDIYPLLNDWAPGDSLDMTSLTIFDLSWQGGYPFVVSEGQVLFSPDPDLVPGDEASFIYEICDIYQHCANATVYIIFNSILPPTCSLLQANNDVATTLENQPVMIDVLHNDLWISPTNRHLPSPPPPARQQQNQHGFEKYEVNVAYSNVKTAWSQISPISISVQTYPPIGQLHLVSQKSAPHFRYSPPARFVGNVSFTYQLCCFDYGCQNATVEISVIPQQPVLHNDTFTVVACEPTVLDVLANDTTPITDWVIGSLNIARGTAHGGSLVVLRHQSAFLYSAASSLPDLCYATPTSDAFQYSICNQAGFCGTAWVTLNIVPPPTTTLSTTSTSTTTTTSTSTTTPTTTSTTTSTTTTTLTNQTDCPDCNPNDDFCVGGIVLVSVIGVIGFQGLLYPSNVWSLLPMLQFIALTGQFGVLSKSVWLSFCSCFSWTLLELPGPWNQPYPSLTILPQGWDGHKRSLLEAEQYSTWTQVGVDELYWTALFWFAISLIGCVVVAALLYLVLWLTMQRPCLNCRRRYRQDRHSLRRSPSSSAVAQKDHRNKTVKLWFAQAFMNLFLFGYIGIAAMSYLQIYYYFTADHGTAAAVTIAFIVLVAFHIAAGIGIVYFLRHRKQRVYAEPDTTVILSALFLTYKPRYNAFWIAVFVRNFFIALFVGVLPGYPVAQVALLLVVLSCYLLLCILLRPHLRMYYWILEVWSNSFMIIVCAVLLITAAGSLSYSQIYIAQYTLVLTTYVFFLGYAIICLPTFIAFLSRLLFGSSFKHHREQFQRSKPDTVLAVSSTFGSQDPILVGGPSPRHSPRRSPRRSARHSPREHIEEPDDTRPLTPRTPRHSDPHSDSEGDGPIKSPRRSRGSGSSSGSSDTDDSYKTYYSSDSDAEYDSQRSITVVPPLTKLPKHGSSATSASDEDEMSGDTVPLSPKLKPKPTPGLLTRIFTPRGQDEGAPHERAPLTPRSPSRKPKTPRSTPSRSVFTPRAQQHQRLSSESEGEEDDIDDDRAPLTPRSPQPKGRTPLRSMVSPARFLAPKSPVPKSSGAKTSLSTPLPRITRSGASTARAAPSRSGTTSPSPLSRSSGHSRGGSLSSSVESSSSKTSLIPRASPPGSEPSSPRSEPSTPRSSTPSSGSSTPRSSASSSGSSTPRARSTSPRP